MTAVSSPQQKNSEMCILSIFVCTIVSVMLFIVLVAIPVANYELFRETTCNVTRVDYPTTLPDINYDVDTANQDDLDWVECDCGRRCLSWTPCIRIYEEDTLIRETVYPISFRYSDCSFNNYSCPQGEDIRLINQTLINAMELAQSYIGFNGTCYETEDGQFIALENNLNLANVIGLSVVLFIMLILTGFACISCSRSAQV